MRKTKTMFEPGESLTLLELLTKAAAHKGLTFWEGAEKAFSKPFAAYPLDDKLLAFLAERNIKRQMRPDTREEIFTLIDESPQERVSGWSPSNGWNFKRREDGAYDLRIDLSVSFGISIRNRAILLYPQAHGTFLSPSDRLPNFRMFKALVESGSVAGKDLLPVLPVARELAACAKDSGHVLVSFTELGLGGIRPISNLFYEFKGAREALYDLVNSSTNPFDPNPLPRHQNSGDELFVLEPAQPKLFELWKKQLEKYRAPFRPKSPASETKSALRAFAEGISYIISSISSKTPLWSLFLLPFRFFF